jgi:hypothetical protein
VLGLCEQVVEGFEFVRLHWRYFAAHDAKGKKRFGLEMAASFLILSVIN